MAARFFTGTALGHMLVVHWPLEQTCAGEGQVQSLVEGVKPLPQVKLHGLEAEHEWMALLGKEQWELPTAELTCKKEWQK